MKDSVDIKSFRLAALSLRYLSADVAAHVLSERNRGHFLVFVPTQRDNGRQLHQACVRRVLRFLLPTQFFFVFRHLVMDSAFRRGFLIFSRGIPNVRQTGAK